MTAAGIRAPAGTARPGAALAVLGAAFLMTVLDSTSVVAALPSIESELGFGPTSVAWVITAYGVAVGGLLLSAGRLADAVGARRLFVLATGVFAAASLACGVAPTAGSLVAARVVQGAAAAAMTPSALALLLAAHPEGPPRNRALAIWGGLGGVGATAGLLLGGTLTSLAGWEWIFLVNLPVCLAVVLLAPLVLPAPARSARRALGLPTGTVLSVALAAAVLAVLRGPEDGWAHPLVLTSAATTAVLLGVFVLVERRSADPVLPPRLLRARGVLAGNATVLVAGVAVDALLLLATRDAQQVMGLGAVGFGGLAAVMTGTSVGGVALGQHLVPRIGSRWVVLVGTALVAVAGLVLHLTPGAGWVSLVPGLLVFGVGMGLAFVAGQIACLSGVEERDAGTASGLEETSFAVGGALGTAVAAAVVTALVAGGSVGTAPAEQVLRHAVSQGYLAVTALGLLGLLAAAALPRTDG